MVLGAALCDVMLQQLVTHAAHSFYCLALKCPSCLSLLLCPAVSISQVSI